MQTAIDLAKTSGIGAVATSHSNHFGATSYYCKMASSAGMAGMTFTNTPSGIPPWGGRKAYFGTNPIAFAFPGREQPVVIDMSSSTVARGNIILAAKENRPIPEGWAINSEGQATTDAKAALEGAVLPMAGPKGYALALAVEILSGILSGSAYGPRVGWIYDENTEPVNIGHFFIAIDIGKLMPLPAFISRLDHMVGEIKSSPKTQGVNEIFIPGERRSINREKRTSGIPVSDQLLSELNELAHNLGVSPL
jgi:LDH2 family malate/lactate/ureidoglycolate dehydrogenase